MIYVLATNGKSMIVLEPGNLQVITNGGQITTPDNAICIAYTPDICALSKDLKALVETKKGLSAEDISALLEAHKGDEAVLPEYFPMSYIAISVPQEDDDDD